MRETASKMRSCGYAQEVAMAATSPLGGLDAPNHCPDHSSAAMMPDLLCPEEPQREDGACPSANLEAEADVQNVEEADGGEEEEEEEQAEEDDHALAQFLEEEVFGCYVSEAQDGDPIATEASERSKRRRTDKMQEGGKQLEVFGGAVTLTGTIGKIPPELFPSILKFLSSEDLSMCAAVCHFFRVAASDECLWRRLYCLRWGAPSPSEQRKKPRGSAWKQLYFERDTADMVETLKNAPSEFREYYVQMQVAKRSQAPLPSQLRDDLVVVDSSIADQMKAWLHSRRLSDTNVKDHWCSGRTCSYYQIGDVFLCEKTGRAHVCDDTCRETALDPDSGLLVCSVSGRCFDHYWIATTEEDDSEPGQSQVDASVAMEEAEPFLGSGRLARAYWLGYSCVDERELNQALGDVLYPKSRPSRPGRYF